MEIRRSSLIGMMLCALTGLSTGGCGGYDGDTESIDADASELGATLHVSNAPQLLQALGKVNPGDTISIAAGADLGKIQLDSKKYPRLAASGKKMITIRSSSKSHRARFDQLRIVGARNVRLVDLELDSKANLKEPFLFESSKNVEVSGCLIQGERVAGLGTGDGFFVRGSDGIEISDNEFRDLRTSLQISNGANAVVSGNEILRGSYDNMHFGSVDGLLVENNTIRALPDSSVKHVDMMQFTNMGGAAPTAHATIRNNDISSTNSVGIHGIYFGNYDAQANDGGTKSEYYRDIVIENNRIESRQMAAIVVSYAIGVTIRGNVTRRPASAPAATKKIQLPTILVEVDDTDVEISGNKTTTPPRAGHLMTGWAVEPMPHAWKVVNNGPVD